ncbi:MAG: hypothetical protein K2X84_06030 [Beijerinckiaceae bacterium]|nr:hypothetical protein [Beijerinckiaceae bacterium]
MALAIARKQHHRVLVLSGRLDGHNGLPSELIQHGEGVQLRALGAYTDSVPTGIFEVLDDDALCAVIDDLQCRGGYRAAVINPNGEQDPFYAL